MQSSPSKDKGLPEGYVSTRRGSVEVVAHLGYVETLDRWGIFELETLLSDPARIRRRSTGRVPHAVVDGPGGRLASLFVREYRHGGLFGRILRHRFISRGRPIRELVVSDRARSARVPTPEIVAYVGTGLPGIAHRRAVMVALEGYRDLVDWLGPGGSTAEMSRKEVAHRRAALGRLAVEVRRLHDAGVDHADLHVKNLMVQSEVDDGHEPAVALVDLDKSSWVEGRDGLSEDRRRRNLVRLDRSVEKLVRRGGSITRTERLRFLREYHGGVLPGRARLEVLLRDRERALRRHGRGWALGRRWRSWAQRGQPS